MPDEFVCGHCLQVTEAGECPDDCPHCHVGFCQECGARNKRNARICVGCGAIPATIRPQMARTSSFGCVYMEHAWIVAGLPKGQDHYFVTSHGWGSKEEMDGRLPIRHMLTKLFVEGGEEHVRDLTAEERDILGIKPPSPDETGPEHAEREADHA